ncbi:hypothetical protein [Kurthia huakuii]|uniref:hypothetical protein n=1 Tax=Kurthia huakuii TaxID=1421019 RepID=UPI0004B6B4B3|nr:hypothetical protein [Kurthia huakuii]MBM7699377.1 hypothetical protein [Kurthia huakuii]
MITYNNAKLVIGSGNYDYETMATMLDMFVMRNRITATQYNELMNMMDTQKEAQA